MANEFRPDDSFNPVAHEPNGTEILASHANELRRQETSIGASWQDTYHQMVDYAPPTLAGLTAFGTGMAARLPGPFGIAGKIGLAAITGIYGTDIGLRFFDHSGSSNDDSKYFRDTAVMLRGVGGWLFGSYAGLNHQARLARTFDLPHSTTVAQDVGTMGNVVRDLPFGQGVSRTIVDGVSSKAVTGDNVVVNFTGPLFRMPPRMIEESEIAAFSAEQQATIRAEIEALKKAGVDPRYLSLSKDGQVLHDVISQGDDLMADYFRKNP